MKTLRNLKIRTKMIIGFGAVITLAAVLCAYSTTLLKTVSDTYGYVYEYPVNAESAILRYNASANEMRRAAALMSAYAAVHNKNAIHEHYNAALEASAQAHQFLDLYEDIINSDHAMPPKEKTAVSAAISDLQSAMDAYETLVIAPVYAAAAAGEHTTTPDMIAGGAAIINTINHISEQLCAAAAGVSAEQTLYAAQTADDAARMIITAAVGVILLSVFLAVIISAVISMPIKQLAGIAENVANGNLDVDIDASAKDETGVLAASIDRVVSVINKLASDLNHVSQMFIKKGDAEYKIDYTDYSGAYLEAAASVNRLIDKRAGVMQMTALPTMEEIISSSSGVSDVIKSIENIAFQTNRLALNAAVEAAKAGVYGKGFAAVSEDIGKYTKNNSKPAKETAQLLEDSIGKFYAEMSAAEESAEAVKIITDDTDMYKSLVSCFGMRQTAV